MIRSGSICMSFLYNYLNEESSTTKCSVEKKTRHLRTISKTLSKYGGILSKISQLLSLNDINNSVFTDCVPYSKKKTLRYLHNFYEKNKHEFFRDIHDIDYNIYKSGSIGQVHQAKYKNTDVILKVQYVGLKKQTQSDLKILNTLSRWLYSTIDLNGAMKAIKHKMNDELDYLLETKNQEVIRSLFSNEKNIYIPKIIKNVSTNKIIVMERIRARSLKKIIKKSTQLEKNLVGELITRFIFKNIYEFGILYSDTHYGNFLVNSENKLVVLDFGCIHYLNENLKNNLKNLHISILNQDKNKFFQIAREIGIYHQNISSESKEYMYNYFLCQYEPWISKKFHFTEEWLDTITKKDYQLMKEWNLPEHMVYFNKIPYGTVHLLTKLNATINMYDLFKDILKY